MIGWDALLENLRNHLEETVSLKFEVLFKRSEQMASREFQIRNPSLALINYNLDNTYIVNLV